METTLTLFEPWVIFINNQHTNHMFLSVWLLSLSYKYVELIQQVFDLAEWRRVCWCLTFIIFFYSVNLKNDRFFFAESSHCTVDPGVLCLFFHNIYTEECLFFFCAIQVSSKAQLALHQMFIIHCVGGDSDSILLCLGCAWLNHRVTSSQALTSLCHMVPRGSCGFSVTGACETFSLLFKASVKVV